MFKKGDIMPLPFLVAAAVTAVAARYTEKIMDEVLD